MIARKENKEERVRRKNLRLKETYGGSGGYICNKFNNTDFKKRDLRDTLTKYNV